MIYLFTGLGADEQVFDSLDFQGHETQAIRWTLPAEKETLAGYSHRVVREQIGQPAGAVLVGISFGGIVAQEVARLVQPRLVIIISSVKSCEQLPFYFRLAGLARVYSWVPVRWLLRPTWLTYWFFGINMPSHCLLLDGILKKTDPVFLKWAIRQILTGRRFQKTENLVHLHGDNDRILPFHCVRNAICVEGGGHLMVLTHAGQVNRLLGRCLS